jgi:pimeloyl-ACP methyl ester carboxylesterase
MYDADVADRLPHVTAPALVLHYNGDRVIPFAGGRQLTAGLPDVRMIALDGDCHLPDATGLDASSTPSSTSSETATPGSSSWRGS